MAQHEFDIVIVGGGSAGYACALRAAQLGLHVALVERDRLGGTCLHNGCIPTKALLHAAETADSVRQAGDFGISATLDGVDIAGVHKYKDAVISRLFKGLSGLVASRGITLVEGTGRVIDPHMVDVDGRQLSGRHLVLATGSRTKSIPGVAPDGSRIITSDHALSLDRIPESAVILGGGVIGCEFASLWRSFGAEVRIVEALPRLLPAEDRDSSSFLQRSFRRRGISFAVNTRVLEVDAQDSNSAVTVTFLDGSSTQADVVLVAAGREPVTDPIELDAVGVETAGGHVVTDAQLRTTQQSIYAVGDVVAGLQLAHRGFQQGIFVAEHIAGLNPEVIDERAIPRVAYCDPQVASVGLTEEAAMELYGVGHVHAATYDLAGNGKSQILKAGGFVKVVRETNGPVLGIHIVGRSAGELIGEAQLLHGLSCDVDDAARHVHAHPTQNEALGEALLALVGKPLHTHA